MSSIAQKPEPTKSEPNQSVEKLVPRRFCTVALIGVDGSGKSSVAKALLKSCPLPLKYLYMGTSIDSSNVALPTSRLIHNWKVYRHKKSLERSGQQIPDKITLHGLEHRVDRRGKLGAFGRLLRRVSEEIFRQLVSWIYQLRGNVVLYDRHFLFDVLPVPTNDSRNRFTDEAHRWFLKKFYPRPGLTIFLDAPADVLYARKQEVPMEHLEIERSKLAQKSCYSKSFVTVDATQPLEDVVESVNKLILDYCIKRNA